MYHRIILVITLITLLALTDKPGVPGRPEIVDIGKGAATLNWKAAKNNGGSPVTNYRIEMRVIGAYRWDLVNATEKVSRNTFTVKDLLEETDYEFRVSAENPAGQSPPSTASRSAKFGKFQQGV